VNNRLVTADTGLDKVEFYSLTGTKLGEFGSYGVANGKFKSPRDIAIDPAGNIYVADSENNRVQKFDSTGRFLPWTVGGLTSCVSVCLPNPMGLSWDFQNNVLLVVSTASSLVFAFDANHNLLWQSPPPSVTHLANPRDVTRGPDGRLWIADYNHQQIKAFDVSASGQWLSTTPAVVLGDGLPNGHGTNELNSPYNVDFSPDGTIAYVADTGNERVASWNISGAAPVWQTTQIGSRCPSTPLIPCANPPASVGLIEQLRRVVVVPNGDIYADDLWGNGIDYFAPNGTPLGEIEGYHAPPYGFAQAFGVAVAPDGTTYGVDRLNQRIERFDSSGIFLNSAGVRGSAAGDESWPESVTVTPNGSVWVADTRHNRLQQWPFDLNTTTPAIIASAGALGAFNNPEGIAADAAGNVWVADTRNNRIVEYSPGTNTFRAFGGFNRPQGVAVSATAIYVADTGGRRIVELDLSGNTVAAYSGALAAPQDIAIARDGTLWITDAGRSQIDHLSANLGTLYADSFGTQGAGNLQFYQPHSLAVSGTTLFVADTFNNRIQEFTINLVA
jgi:sugar lactone lactonase YvrE